MTEEQKSRLRTYAWNYFAYHAGQRMTSFYYYIVMVLAILAGFFTAANRVHGDHFRYLAPLGLLITFLSFMFSLLDKRNKELIGNGKAALKYLDELEGISGSQEKPNPLDLFSRDEASKALKPKWPTVERQITFSIIFGWIFGCFGLAGIALAILCFFYKP